MAGRESGAAKRSVHEVPLNRLPRPSNDFYADFNVSGLDGEFAAVKPDLVQLGLEVCYAQAVRLDSGLTLAQVVSHLRPDYPHMRSDKWVLGATCPVVRLVEKFPVLEPA